MTINEILNPYGLPWPKRAWERTKELQKERTKKRAEVVTPAWIVRDMVKMIADQMDDLVSGNWLEITCGEAPFAANRYDCPTGEPIPVKDRAGILDVKMKAIRENQPKELRLRQAYDILKTVYGYEKYQDSLILGRLNVYLDFIETCQDMGIHLDQYGREAAARIIRSNFIQMDGLTGLADDGREAVFYDWGTFEYFTMKELENGNQNS